MSIIQDTDRPSLADGLFSLPRPAGVALLLVPAVLALWLLIPDRAHCTSPIVGQQALPWSNDERASGLARYAP